MAGSLNLGSFPTASANGQVALSLEYNDSLQATQLSGNNSSPTDAFGAKVVGLNPDGSENPAASYSLLVQPGQSAFVSIGAGKIQLATNAKGKIAGFNTYTGL